MFKIVQNNTCILSAPGKDNPSAHIIFNNLTGKNCQGKEYSDYLKGMFHDFPNLREGKIELRDDDTLLETGEIKLIR